MSAYNGKVVLVTGAASGMGRIYARRLADQGATVVAFDLNEAGLAETADGYAAIHGYTCDISSRQAIDAALETVRGNHGQIDELVHAAALMPSHKLEDQSVEKVEQLFQVNFFGTVYMIKALLPDMLARQQGRMVIFGSIAGWALVPKMGAYCATKSAVNTYVETLQKEIRGRGVSVHLVCPPAVNTPLINQTVETDTPGSIREALQNDRLAKPEAIVDSIEKGVSKGREIIYPGEARLLMLWKMLLPGLWWRTVLSFEK
ncbi:MAG: SDR family NAD(P)-dependent oxidoreductase [Halieaceae bacterium]|nr:SDR family NAD(P)-dependent oxidoreductase [Halieaceae bacterium]